MRLPASRAAPRCGSGRSGWSGSSEWSRSRAVSSGASWSETRSSPCCWRVTSYERELRDDERPAVLASHRVAGPAHSACFGMRLHLGLRRRTIRTLARALDSFGFFFGPKTYESPVPETVDVERQLRAGPSELVGIEIDQGRALAFLDE